MDIVRADKMIKIGEVNYVVGDPVHIIVCNTIGLNICYDVCGILTGWTEYKLYVTRDGKKESIEYFMIRDIAKLDQPCININGLLFKVGDEVEVTYKDKDGRNVVTWGCLFRIDDKSEDKIIRVGVFDIKVGHIISISKGGVTHEGLSFRV